MLPSHQMVSVPGISTFFERVHSPSNPPDLQRPRPKNTRLLVICHERRRHPLVAGDLLVLVCLLASFAVIRGGIGVTRDDDMVVLGVVFFRSALGIILCVLCCRLGVIEVLDLVFLEGSLFPDAGVRVELDSR